MLTRSSTKAKRSLSTRVKKQTKIRRLPSIPSDSDSDSDSSDLETIELDIKPFSDGDYTDDESSDLDAINEHKQKTKPKQKPKRCISRPDNIAGDLSDNEQPIADIVRTRKRSLSTVSKTSNKRRKAVVESDVSDSAYETPSSKSDDTDEYDSCDSGDNSNSESLASDEDDAMYKEENDKDLASVFGLSRTFQTFLDTLPAGTNEEHNKTRTSKWDKRLIKNMAQKDVKKIMPEYKAICSSVNKMPSIKDILTIPMPFKEKCLITEKLLILDNVMPSTFEHLGLKREILETIDKYSMSNNTDKYYKAFDSIEEQLEVNDSITLPLKYKILAANIPFGNKQTLYTMYKKFVKSTDEESGKILNWINCAMDIPTDIKPLKINMNDSQRSIREFLYNVRVKLDVNIYGLENVKEHVLFIVNNKITNPKMSGCSIGLAGVPGVAKTHLTQTLSEAIGIPMVQIPMGGCNDAASLLGHSLVYEGSHPGFIVDALIELKQSNGIIYFDELDKLGNTPHGNEVKQALLHITDFTQNKHFKDKYLGNVFSIDLSNIWFIYSLNDKSSLDRTLSDRLTIIDVPGYNAKQKFIIAKDYLTPRIMKEMNIKPGELTFSDEAYNYIIQETNKLYDSSMCDSNGNSGVRQLKSVLTNTLLKLNILKTTTISSPVKKPKGSIGLNNRDQSDDLNIGSQAVTSVLSETGADDTDDLSGFDLKLSFNIKNFKLPYVITQPDIVSLGVISPSNIQLSILNMYM
jgi:ATP-dependent Lon protease